MWRLVAILIMFSSMIYGDEYDFDMDAIEKKPYEYSGYLRVEDKIQQLNKENDESQNYLHIEGLLNLSYEYETLKFESSVIASYDYIKDKIAYEEFVVNDLYLENRFNVNHTVLIGKESLRWGKGYFFNPVAYFDRPKDPSEPTQAREGFNIVKYSYNKAFNSVLKNLSFDAVYLPSTDKINKDYYRFATKQRDANNLAFRLYMLLYDTDIDIIYNYSDEASQKIGFDFSKNIQTNFEIHGEYSNIIDSGYRYLLGIRYLSEFELTIISEYLYYSDGLNKEEIQESDMMIPFSAKDYWVTLLTQKEPFEWLYSSIYYKNMMNLEDKSQQNRIGITYSFKNNIFTDLSYNLNSGDNLSEFAKKQVKSFLWLRITWNF